MKPKTQFDLAIVALNLGRLVENIDWLEPCEECTQIRDSASQDDSKIGEHLVVHKIMWQILGDRLADTQTTLIGENILTPSLTTRGWKFWKKPPITDVARMSVEAASLRCSERMAREFMQLTKKIPKSINQLQAMESRGEAVRLLASLINNLSSDLKQVLEKDSGLPWSEFMEKPLPFN